MPCDPGIIAQTEGGEWRTAPLSSPLTVQPGDRVEIDGTTAWLWRNGYYIDSREIGESEPYTPEAFEGPQTLDRVVFYRSSRMAAVATTLTNVTIDPNGTVRVNFSDGSEREVSVASMEAIADGLDTNVTLAQDILLAKLIREQPSLDDPDALNGSTVSIDTQGATPIVYTES